jgi:hypothetical protein
MEQPVQGHGKIVFCMEHAPARVRSVHLPRLGISYRSVALERMMTASGPWPLTAAGPAVRPDHVRNNVEHWFKPATAEDEAALALLTGCGAEETRRGQASAGAAARRAEVRPAHSPDAALLVRGHSGAWHHVAHSREWEPPRAQTVLPLRGAVRRPARGLSHARRLLKYFK